MRIDTKNPTGIFSGVLVMQTTKMGSPAFWFRLTRKKRISLHRRLAFVCFANSCVTDVCNACILVSTNAQKTCVSLHRKAVADDACASSGLAHRAKLSPINGLHQPFHLPILSMSHPFCRVRIRRFPNLERWCIYHSRKSQGSHTWCLLECHSRRLMERPW